MGSQIWACPEVPLCPLGSFSLFFPLILVKIDPTPLSGPLQAQKLLVADPVAVSYVLQNSDTFQKSEILRFNLGAFTGKGMDDSPGLI
jgi:hypothetical protein